MVPRQFYLDLGRRGGKLGGYGDDPHFAVIPNVGVGCHDHGGPAFAVTVLRIEQFHPDDPTATERRHGILPSEQLALFRVPRCRGPVLRPDPIEVGRRQRIISRR